MKFALRCYRVSSPVPSLAGGMTRYKPVIPLTVFGPTGSETPFVLVDTGADDVVLPVHLAQRIGVDLSRGADNEGPRVSAACNQQLFGMLPSFCRSVIPWKRIAGAPSSDLLPAPCAFHFLALLVVWNSFNRHWMSPIVNWSSHRTLRFLKPRILFPEAISPAKCTSQATLVW